MPRPFGVGAAALLVFLVGCNRPLADAPPALRAALSTPTAAAPSGLGPATSASGAPAGTPTAHPTPPVADGPQSCTNDAEFIEDVTVPDGSIFVPGVTFEKIWSVRNSGTCDWGPEHRLVSLGDPVLDGPEESALFPARAGAVAEWRLSLRAPDAPGEYLARWQARGPDGMRFGDEVFVLIFVELPTPTPSPAPTATP